MLRHLIETIAHSLITVRHLNIKIQHNVYLDFINVHKLKKPLSLLFLFFFCMNGSMFFFKVIDCKPYKSGVQAETHPNIPLDIKDWISVCPALEWEHQMVVHQKAF